MVAFMMICPPSLVRLQRLVSCHILDFEERTLNVFIRH